jgi:hypothetical protein
VPDALGLEKALALRKRSIGGVYIFWFSAPSRPSSVALSNSTRGLARPNPLSAPRNKFGLWQADAGTQLLKFRMRT